MTPNEPRDYCARCGVAYEPLQEYCLECGNRLPANRGVVGVLAAAWQRRLSWYPGDWIWPVLLFAVLTAIATTAAVAANSARTDATPTAVAITPSVTVGPGVQPTLPVTSGPVNLPSVPAPTITNGPLPTAPGSGTGGTRTAPPPVNPNALAFWPSGQSGYTDVLESLPAQGGRASAVARARQAKRNGLKTVGVLVSSQYSSLHPGYFVVFAGIYRTQAEASAGLATAHAKGFPDAYQTRITR